RAPKKLKRALHAPGATQLGGYLSTGLVEGVRADRVADLVDAEAKTQHNAGNDPITAAAAEIPPVEELLRRRTADRTGTTRRIHNHAPKINRTRLTQGYDRPQPPRQNRRFRPKPLDLERKIAAFPALTAILKPTRLDDLCR